MRTAPCTVRDERGWCVVCGPVPGDVHQEWCGRVTEWLITENEDVAARGPATRAQRAARRKTRQWRASRAAS